MENENTQLLAAISNAMYVYPNQRLAQIIVNATNRRDIFYLTNKELAIELEHYVAQAD